MCKILILVLSFNEEPFSTLMRTQQQTFDSIEAEGVKTVYYHGGLFPQGSLKFAAKYSNPHSSWERVAFDITDEYYYMAGKFQKALEYTKDFEYDYIFRTNSSSYVNKKALVKFAESLPKEKLYAGWEIEGNAGYNVCSGAGFFLSPDTAKILRDNIDPDFEREEDVYCAQLLHEHGIEIIDDKSRIDVNNFNPYLPLHHYHYRFKGPHGDRRIDAHNMILLHKQIISQ